MLSIWALPWCRAGAWPYVGGVSSLSSQPRMSDFMGSLDTMSV
jgi:hypothetical protein